jgi:hypothetical protein
MEEQGTKKTFNHSKASVGDKIALIGELEHGRAHCVRSAAATWKEEDDSESMQYLIWAKRFQEIRRDYMRKHFSELKESDWCLFKVCSRLRQLLYETCEGDIEELKEMEDLIDEITGKALNMDLSDCEVCRSDRGETEES